ncbi:hypothetical protein [Pedobacter hiemivivus]|uniref:Uncharacterized protein n=1 Tax=Pedobacter hiemivivus TaxID=2530454 RepID=A0A4R0N4X7_9SPHI|nr:hypothetical protein [Pedobacter hiemivivus]TCC94981.1 hypothetical protein EZ444_15840 [Pedobacter hiemivivus]
MKKIFDRIDRIRASGTAVLDVESGTPYYRENGKRFPVQSMGIPGLKCPITLLIKGKSIDFTIHDVM